VITVMDEDRLAGIGPFFVTGGRVSRARLLAAPVSNQLGPLALPAFERQTAATISAVLSSQGIPRLTLEGVKAAPPWGPIFGRSLSHRVHKHWWMQAPIITLGEGTFDDWFASRSANFRQQMRRDRRKLEKAGASVRMTTEDSIESDVRSFSKLHRARWATRGGSATLSSTVEAMVLSAARRLIPVGAMRLWNIDVAGDTISSHMFLTAGDVASYWLGGFDDGWSEMRPGMQALMAALEHSWSVGDKIFDLGSGDDPYKLRFTDEHDTLEWWDVLELGRPGAWGVVLAERAKRSASRHLPEPTRKRVRAFLRSTRSRTD